MVWQVTTKTLQIFGSASMGTGTALNRAMTVIPSGVTITSFLWEWELSPGAGAGTYNVLTTGSGSRVPSWITGISYVLSGNTPVNILTSPDDSTVLDIDRHTPGFDRLTINQTGSPAYQDQYRWSGAKRGRLQLPSGAGGTIYMHVGNTDTGTTTIQWDVLVRATYV